MLGHLNTSYLKPHNLNLNCYCLNKSLVTQCYELSSGADNLQIFPSNVPGCWMHIVLMQPYPLKRNLMEQSCAILFFLMNWGKYKYYIANIKTLCKVNWVFKFRSKTGNHFLWTGQDFTFGVPLYLNYFLVSEKTFS